MTRPKIHGMKETRCLAAFHRVQSLLGMSPDQKGAPADAGAGVCFVCLIPENRPTMDRVITRLFVGLGCELVEVPAHRAFTRTPVTVLFARWLSHETYLGISSRFTSPHGWISRNAFERKEGPQAVLEKAGVALPGSASYFGRSQP